MTSQFKVLISGGGPAGLVAAHSLHLAGVDFEVLEARDEVANDQGASLVLQPGSLRVMSQFGIYEKLHEIGGEMTRKTAFTWDGRQIGDTTSFHYMKDNHGSGPLAFHRAQLIQTIYDGLPEAAKSRVHTGKKIENVTSNDTGVTVTCTDGTSYSASVLVGADGCHSRTRRQMRKLVLESEKSKNKANFDWDPESPYYSDYKCLWCSFPLPTATGETTETHNKDRSVMYLSGKTRGWMFLYEKLPERTYARCSYSEDDCVAFADTFAEYPITSTLKVKDVFANRLTVGMSNLEEGVIQHWSWGRIALVGDAAHKYTPNGGLGFNNGIQDVVALCNGLVAAVHAAPSGLPDSDTLTRVFESYQAQRRDLATSGWCQSQHTTKEQADANWLYYLMGHYVMWFRIIQYFLLDWFLPRKLRESLVLDYVEGDEPFQGAVSWAHPIKRRSVVAVAPTATVDDGKQTETKVAVLDPAL